VLETLAEIIELMGTERYVVVAREVTKLHEEFLRGRVVDVFQELQKRGEVKGEITLLIAKADSSELRAASAEVNIGARVREIMAADQVDEKSALKKAAKERGIGKSEAYRELQRCK
jgi:16S rRNA (cytidine1402-2'-O)-methyltransferase